ncbi:ParB N-terminal domain-containing protein [Caulobacter sp.]|uniref:ParB/RepB/Spo0J family partition protein n=1 Tax=Caulobacter sp. TaxID=78 RepID=UPI0031D4B65A
MTRQSPSLSAAESKIRIPLRDLGLAPENLRFSEPADDRIGQLADTIAAAGVIIPPIVRAGRKNEQAYMALDGRRRRLALLALVERGVIDEDYGVECILAVGKAAQAAAIVLPNAETAPVHIASIIVAIGNLRKAKMDTAFISASLGYSELEVKRLEALAGVHPTVLTALRQGRLTLKQVRSFTRIADKKQQEQLAQSALDGHFQDYQLRNIVDTDRVTTLDNRFSLVGADRYIKAGGRLDVDLFGELPDGVLDPEILEQVWRERIKPLVAKLQNKGLAVFVGPDAGYRAPDDFESLPYVIHATLPEAQRTARLQARDVVDEKLAALREVGLAADDAIDAIAEVLIARETHAAAALDNLTLGAVLLSPNAERGVDATFYTHPEVEADEALEDEEDEDEDERPGVSRAATVVDLVTPKAVVAVEGVSHSLHEVRTDLATRGLIRDLADNPGAALTAIVAQLFKLLALTTHTYHDESALTVSATKYSRGGMSPHPALDGEVRDRLAARREAYLASGQRPIGFVDALPHGEKMALLAELVAISLNAREARTSLLRHGARAEAAEIAALCDADLSVHWTPDQAFLSSHSKAQLMAMLVEMKVEDARAATLKKDELVTFVAEAAAERQWVPGSLAWSAKVEVDEPVEESAEDNGDISDGAEQAEAQSSQLAAETPETIAA